MDLLKGEEQRRALPELVASVKQNPGFVRGFWATDVENVGQSVTFIVFETLDQARSFRDAVIANAPAQSSVGVGRGGLRIAQIQADA